MKSGETATFTTIPYDSLDAVGTYTYTIQETNDGQPGVKYDDHIETVTIVVTDAGDGTLKVTYNGKDTFETAKFTNSYNASGSATLQAVKAGENLAPLDLSDRQSFFERLREEDTGLW